MVKGREDVRRAVIMVNKLYYSTFIHCTNSDFLIGLFVPRDPGL